MGRPKRAVPAEIEPEFESQETDSDFLTPEQSVANSERESSVSETVSKAQMVREALAQGIDNPGAGVAFIKSQYGVDLPKPMWSSYVAQQKARDRKSSGEETTPRQSRAQSPTPTGGIPASFGQDIKTIKGLIEQAGGGDALKDLANGLADLTQKYGRAGLDSLIDAFE